MPTPRASLIAAGATEAALDLELRAGRSVSVFRGVHLARGHDLGHCTRVRAAIATQDPRAVATFTTAAVMHGLRWLPEPWSGAEAVVHVAVPQLDARRHRPGIRLHRRLITKEDIVLVDGVPCFSVARTLVEIARDRDVPRLVAVQIIDGALRDVRTTKHELAACLTRFPGERGIARARERVHSSREGVDSPPETRMRLMLEDGGVSGVDVGIEISDADGGLLARGDLGLRRYLLWGEYDGFKPHTERRAFRGDRVGDRWLQRRGWFVMRFVDEDFRRPAAVCREWQQAIADAPARIAALSPSRSPEVGEARRLLGLDNP